MRNIIKIFSIITSIIMISIITFYGELRHASLEVFATGLFMLTINPIMNLYRSKRKEIVNPIYYLILIGLSLYSIIFYIKVIYLYYKNYNLDFGNASQLYSTEKSPIIILLFIILYILSHCFKKIETNRTKDISKLTFFVIAVFSFMPLFSDWYNLFTIINLVICVFSIIMLFKLNNIRTAFELRGIYLLLIVLSLISNNVIAVILLINLFIDLDKLGLNI